ncbi:hypothetical protein HYR69_10845, partial [Candidatus Sumerlaeota bacterium]|nr:hypothetical protein [Candidatus Sumerlaeota bacterium]
MKLKFLTTLSGAISLLFVWGAAPRDARGTEPDEIAAIEASADGRYIAVAKAAGELGILDLKDASDFPIYTRHLSGGFGWSPDSKILAYTEQIPGHPPEIWTVNPQSKGPAQLLLGGDDWKGQPHWLAPNEIAYRSDRDSDHVNLWSVTWSAGEGTTYTLIHPAAKLL